MTLDWWINSKDILMKSWLQECAKKWVAITAGTLLFCYYFSLHLNHQMVPPIQIRYRKRPHGRGLDFWVRQCFLPKTFWRIFFKDFFQKTKKCDDSCTKMVCTKLCWKHRQGILKYRTKDTESRALWPDFQNFVQ